MLSTQDLNVASATSAQGKDFPLNERLIDCSGLPYCSPLALSPNPRFDLLEYQVKQIFRDVGIPVLPSQLVTTASEVKSLPLAYPLMLKPQVHGKRQTHTDHNLRITNGIDAIAAAHRLFDSAVQDEYPEYLLAEAFYPNQSQIGLSLNLDRESGLLELQGWRCGPITQDPSLPGNRAKLHCLQAATEFSQNQATKLAQALGLEEESTATLVGIIEKMYILQAWLGLESLSIDPLGINREGEMVVLDGKIRFTEAAIEQQPQLRKLFSPKPEVSPPIVQLDGNIGILGNGMGATLTTIDSLKQAGGEPAAFVSLKERAHGRALRRSPSSFQNLSSAQNLSSSHNQAEQVKQALDNLARLKEVKLILVNWSSLSTSCREIASLIADYFHGASQHIHLRGLNQSVPLVVCLDGPEAEAGRSLLEDVGIVAVGSLEEAIAEGIGLAKMRRVP